jgi:hypothetical protein
VIAKTTRAILNLRLIRFSFSCSMSIDIVLTINRLQAVWTAS